MDRWRVYTVGDGIASGTGVGAGVRRDGRSEAEGSSSPSFALLSSAADVGEAV